MRVRARKVESGGYAAPAADGGAGVQDYGFGDQKGKEDGGGALHTRPVRRASCAASCRVPTCNLARMLRMWLLTV